jgi:hypothetical protein
MDRDARTKRELTNHVPPLFCADGSIRGLVVAGAAAGFAVHQAVGADTDIEDSLAQTAVFITLAAALRLFTLRAANFRGIGSGAHGVTIRAAATRENVTLVIGEIEEKTSTTKDTKVHEGNHDREFLRVPSCPLWLMVSLSGIPRDRAMCVCIFAVPYNSDQWSSNNYWMARRFLPRAGTRT